GIGLSEPLWRRQAELVGNAMQLVQGCPCRAGCPSCVGPVLDDRLPVDASPKAHALRVLAALAAA
ncbi:MAG: DUF1998 domain-containing protein, partial [Rhodanobacter sp.]